MPGRESTDGQRAAPNSMVWAWTCCSCSALTTSYPHSLMASFQAGSTRQLPKAATCRQCKTLTPTKRQSPRYHPPKSYRPCQFHRDYSQVLHLRGTEALRTIRIQISLRLAWDRESICSIIRSWSLTFWIRPMVRHRQCGPSQELEAVKTAPMAPRCDNSHSW